MAEADEPLPLILPRGDQGLLVRFGSSLSDRANRAAIDFARRVSRALPAGVREIDPNLITVLLKFDPAAAIAAVIRRHFACRAAPPSGPQCHPGASCSRRDRRRLPRRPSRPAGT